MMNGKKHIISAAKVTLALAVCAAISLSCDKKETESPLPEPSQPEKTVEFEIKTSDVTTWSAKLEITPSEDSAPYYYGVISKDDYEALKTDDALISSAIEHLQEVSALYESDYTAIAKSKASVGAVSAVKDGFSSETDYYAYAFAFTEDYLGGNSLVKTAFRTGKVESVDCSFSIDITGVWATTAKISVAPTDGDCYYFCDFVTAIVR